MSQESVRNERIRALVEVVHSVLLSLEDLSAGDENRLRSNWGRVVTGVQDRLSSALDWGGGSADIDEPDFGPGPGGVFEAPVAPASSSGHEAVESPAEDDAEDSIGLGSIDLFLMESDGQQGRQAPPERAHVHPPREAPSPPGGDFEIPGAGAPAAGEEAQELRRELDALRAENERLREELRARPADVPVGSGAAAGDAIPARDVLQALGIPDPSHPSLVDVSDRVRLQLNEVGTYFTGTHRNLVHVFGKLQIGVNLPTLGDSMLVSVTTGADLREYLECLRDCWKILVGGTWNSLRGWCEKLQASLDPAQIEEISRQQRMKVWDVYTDLVKRMALYNNLIEMLRTKIKAQVRERQPRLLQ